MTDKTATQNLTRTTSTDDPKLMDVYLGTLAEEVDRRVTSHFYDLNRVRNRPFAIVRKYAVEQYDGSIQPSVSFDTVDEDTANMVDFSDSTTVINLPTPGFWAVGGYIQCTGFGSAASDTSLQLTAGDSFVSAFTAGIVRDSAIGLAAVSVHTVAKITDPTNKTVRMSFTWSGGSTSNLTTLQFAEMWAYKVRDV